MSPTQDYLIHWIIYFNMVVIIWSKKYWIFWTQHLYYRHLWFLLSGEKWFLVISKRFFPQTKDIIFLIRQQLIFEWYYICQKSRQSINKKLYQKGPVTESFIHFELKKTLAKIVDVHLDADLNLFCLTLLAGTPHVLISSLFSQVSIFKIKMY